MMQSVVRIFKKICLSLHRVFHGIRFKVMKEAARRETGRFSVYSIMYESLNHLTRITSPC